MNLTAGGGKKSISIKRLWGGEYLFFTMHMREKLWQIKGGNKLFRLFQIETENCLSVCYITMPACLPTCLLLGLSTYTSTNIEGPQPTTAREDRKESHPSCDPDN